MIYQLKHGMMTNKKIIVLQKHIFGKASPRITRLMFAAHRIKYNQNTMYSMSKIVELFDTMWLQVGENLFDAKMLEEIKPTSILNQPIINVPLVWSLKLKKPNEYLLINKHLSIGIHVTIDNKD